MTAGKEERGDRRCSQSRGGSEAPIKTLASSFPSSFCLQSALLSQVDLLMPLSPNLRRREHTTGATHVSKRSLTGTVCTSSRYTRDTGNSATWRNQQCQSSYVPKSKLKIQLLTGSPRLGRSLMTGLLAYCIWLSLVLSHASVYCPELSSVP